MLNRASNSSLTFARFNHFFFCAFSVLPSSHSPRTPSKGGWSYRFSRFAVKLCRRAKKNSKQKTTQTKQNQFQFQTKRFVQITQRFPLLVFTCYVRVASSAQDGRKSERQRLKTDLQYRVSEVFFANCPFRLSKKRFKEMTRARDLFSARNIRICSVSL